MASRFVSGTYQSYKAGTGKVLHWLYENALKCGYGDEQTEDGEEDGEVEADTGPNNNSKPKPKSKKGKGSKAKGSGKANSRKAGTPIGSTPKYIGVKEFLALAEAIAASETKIKVPLWVTSMIAEVISARSKSARWFSRQAGDTTSSDFEESNLGHQHFIKVLETVRDILLKLQEPSEKPTAREDMDESDPLDQVTNIFDALEIEPDTEHTMTEPTPSATKVQSAARVIFEEERSTEETLWLIYCFFKDFNIARDHLKDLWTAYKHGAVDLTTVALSTNTAFEIFKRAEIELMVNLQSTLPPDLVSQISGYREIQGLLFMTTAINRGQNPEDKASPQDPYNYQLFDIADWTGLPVYIILDSFMDVVEPGQAPVCKPGYFGKLNLNEDVLSPREKFTQDKIVLLERVLPEFIFLLNVKDPQTKATLKFPAEDELTGGVLQMVRTKKVPIWLVLAFQVQLDIHYMLLEDTAQAHSELLAAAKRATTTIKAYQNFSKDMHIVNWPKSNDKLLELNLWEWNQWILTDLLDPLRSRTFAQLGYSKRGNYVLFKTHPVLCGMMLFRINLNMQDFGTALSNAWGALPTILHLYNACVAERLLAKPWLDLEALIIANTPAQIFVGDRPLTPQEYLKRFMMVMGYSATAFSANKRSNGGLTASRKGPRQMLGKSVIAEIYCDRYSQHFESRDGAQNSGFTLAAIEKLLAEATTGPAEENLEGGGSFRKKLTKGRPKKALLTKFTRIHRLTTIQLLTALESSMHHESFAFNVDYFSLHMRCYQLLRTIASELDSTFIKYFGPAYVEEESQLPFLVGYIFQVVAGGSKAAEVYFPKIRGDAHGSKILVETTKIIAKLIESEGEIEIEKVKKASHVFDGLSPAEIRVDTPTLKMEPLRAAVKAFNSLPRKQMAPNGKGVNHWHFSLRNVDPRMDPPDIVFLISPVVLMHVAAPSRGMPISTLPTISDEADMVVLLLLESFTKGLLKGNQAHLPKFAPWTWSCSDAALAKAVENKLKNLGVRKELCTVQRGSEEHNKMSDEVWDMMKGQLVAQYTR